MAAAFRHRTSRAQEPHLHTHVIVANMARGSDGEWRALDGEAILKTYRLAAGYLYEAQLRDELTRRLGLEWTAPVKGMADLWRVPEQANRAFSTRRQSLIEHMEALGTKGFAAARIAALATREAKEQVELPRLREEWKARAAEHGLGRRELEELVAQHSLSRDHVELEELAARLFAPDGITARRTTFTLPELVCTVAGALAEGASAEQVLETAEELACFPGVEVVESGEPGRPPRFTTRELLAVEQEALKLALNGRDVGAPRPDERILLRSLIPLRALSNEQRHLVREASLSRDRVVCVVGVAGAGKTTALRALAQAHRRSGIDVLGAAPSGRAADELAAATGIASSTLHRLVVDTNERGLPHGCVLVVDEAGMADTRVLAPILRLVERAEGKLLLVGDPAQLPAVGAGGLYPALCEQLGALALGENRRQRDLAERQALTRLRAGDPDPYLAYAARHGRLAVDDDPLQAKQRLLADWWRAASRDSAGNVMLAYHRDDVRDLNRAAHALMLRRNRLGGEAVTFDEREFRIGDRVLCRRNDVRLGVRNGTRGAIVDLDSTTITLRDDAGARHRLPLPYAAEHLDYGYALTGHAAQGGTFDRAFVLLPDRGALREWGYVACSRARAETRLYLAGWETEPETDAREPDWRSASERAARALMPSSAEPLALERTAAPRDARARLLARRREQLDLHRAQAEQRLAAAERQLHNLGWRARDKQGLEARAEIALQRTALRLADQQHAKLTALRTRQPPALAREQERRLSLRPELTGERELHRRGLDLGLDR